MLSCMYSAIIHVSVLRYFINIALAHWAKNIVDKAFQCNKIYWLNANFFKLKDAIQFSLPGNVPFIDINKIIVNRYTRAKCSQFAQEVLKV